MRAGTHATPEASISQLLASVLRLRHDPPVRHCAPRRTLRWSLAALTLLASACQPPASTARSGAPAGDERPSGEAAARCPAAPIPAPGSPGVAAALRSPESWLGDQPDRVLMDAAQIAAANARNAQVEGAARDVRSVEVAEARRVDEDIAERLAWLELKVRLGEYEEGRPGVMDEVRARLREASPVDELRVVAGETALWCLPSTDGLYTPARDLAFDRNRCSGLHPGEAVRVLRRSTDSRGAWSYVHAGHSVGWVLDPLWTPPLSADDLDGYLEPERQLMVLTDGVRGEAGPTLRFGTALPLVASDADGFVALIPTPDGLREARFPASDAVHEGPLPLTRRNLLRVAFSALDDPYGWGGWQAGRDCSRYLHDLLAVFGLTLGRNSGVQAQLGTRSVELEGLTEREKLERIEAAAKDGVVLLYMPGHIMLYLGQHEGHPYAISSLSEYLEPCEGGADTIYRLDRVEVTTLELGRGTERTAFIERLTRMVVFTGGA